MISVVIPLYNKEKQIAKTIESVLAQTYQDFEIVIVNDGSTDGSVAEVEKIPDTRIRLINQKNSGVSVARNRGIAEAKGEFIALLDGDDLWMPTYLETHMSLTHKYPECDVFAVNYEFKNTAGKTTSTIIRKLPFTGEDGVLTNYFEVASCSHPPICSISIMVRKGIFDSIDGFPTGIKSGEDLLTWARLACRYKIAYAKDVCAIYNLGDGYDYVNTPPRRQDAGDPVGRELKKLYKKYHADGLKNYIGHWHKMRSSVAIRYFDRWEALSEAFKSIYYFPQKKTLPFVVMPFLPKRVLRKLFKRHQ